MGQDRAPCEGTSALELFPSSNIFSGERGALVGEMEEVQACWNLRPGPGGGGSSHGAQLSWASWA